MRRITKGREPKSLIAHRRAIRGDDDPRWDDYRDKEAAFLALCLEQEFLCAYCMSRIKPNQEPRKIEHWIACHHTHESPHEPSFHAEERFQWTNLLGVCPGGVSPGAPSPRSAQHCDSHRGSKPLHVHPALAPDIETKFQYHDNGTIWSVDPDAQRDIDETLNLNVAKLKRNRARVFVELRKRLGKSGTWTVMQLRKELARWNTASRSIRYEVTTHDAESGATHTRVHQAPALPEYAQTAVYFLERHIRKRT